MTALPSFATATPFSELPCDVLTGYEVRGVLANCDASFVYAAGRVDRAGQAFALKVYEAPLKRETFAFAAAATQLCGPCVVPVVEYGLWQGKPAIVSELVTGLSLQRLLSGLEQRLPLAAALRIGSLVCRALCEAHGAEGGALVHGRVEPSHVLLGRDGAVQLSGFGTSTALSRLHPSYVSPEVAAGERADVLSDVYSLGAVLYELTTGEAPIGARPERPSELSPAIDDRLEDVILACLDRDPSERPVSVRAVEQCLDACFDEFELVPEPAGLAALVGGAR